MAIKGLLIACLCCLSTALLGQHVLVEGMVIDADTKASLGSSHVVLNGLSGTTPDIDGKFQMKVAPGDTLLITHVGYNDQVVLIPATLREHHYFIRVGLIPATVQLDEVTVYQWPATVAAFKNEILAINPEEEDQIKIPGAYYGPRRPVEPGIGSPISFIASKLSRRARIHKQFLKRKQDILEHQHARARWNSDYVQEITGIEDEEELASFMEFCKFTDQYLGELVEYDLIVAINECYEDFKKHN